MNLEDQQLNFYQKQYKNNNPDKIIPLNLGKKWTDEEDNTLLQNLNDNLDITVISSKHERTKGSIISRQKIIAYKMFIDKIPIPEIIEKTKIDILTFNDYIKKKEVQKPEKKDKFSINNEIVDIKNDIRELKKVVIELSEMIRAVYEFEEN